VEVGARFGLSAAQLVLEWEAQQVSASSGKATSGAGVGGKMKRTATVESIEALTKILGDKSRIASSTKSAATPSGSARKKAAVALDSLGVDVGGSPTQPPSKRIKAEVDAMDIDAPLTASTTPLKADGGLSQQRSPQSQSFSQSTGKFSQRKEAGKVTLSYRPVHTETTLPLDKGGIDPAKIAPKARVY